MLRETHDYSEPDWGLVEAHLATTGSVKESSKVIGLNENQIRRALRDDKINYPDNWDAIKEHKKPHKSIREKVTSKGNHPAKGFANEIEKKLIWYNGPVRGKLRRIAEEVGCTEENVWYINNRLTKRNQTQFRKRNGHSKSFTKEEITRIKRLFKQGKSRNDIANLMGCSANTIRDLKLSGEIQYIDRFKWDIVPDEYFFIKGTDRTGWEHNDKYKDRCPTKLTVERRIRKKKLLKRVCSISGKKYDSRRPDTRLYLIRINDDLQDNRLENFKWISAKNYKFVPPPKGFSVRKPWKKIEKLFNQGKMNRNELLNKYDLSIGAWNKAVKDGLFIPVSVKEHRFQKFKKQHDWKLIQEKLDQGMSMTSIADELKMRRGNITRGAELGLIEIVGCSGNLSDKQRKEKIKKVR